MFIHSTYIGISVHYEFQCRVACFRLQAGCNCEEKVSIDVGAVFVSIDYYGQDYTSCNPVTYHIIHQTQQAHHHVESHLFITFMPNVNVRQVQKSKLLHSFFV